eukprot:TRINITY_DN31810_c0_g1_i1.p1 TRINITY_DN31810_c0_g1~~TRINITY_DN31810_c0_g1_i1.p1  ORF type:complete len:774 (+),score=113.69 TRINITY_DN31810_c0_g1_i1:112-2433(+)
MRNRQVSQGNRLGEPQLITDSVGSIRATDPDAVREEVAEGYRRVGYLINDEEEAFLLADVECADCPLIGVSQGFTNLTGFKRDQLLGRNCRVMHGGVPEVAISKSVRKNLRDFCRMCRAKYLSHISEVTSLQPNAREDGSQFVNFFLVGLVHVHNRPYLLGVQRSVGEGLFVTLNSHLLEQITEAARSSFKRLRAKLCRAEPVIAHLPRMTSGGSRSSTSAPGFSFFSERLQDHCLLLNGDRTAIRREPQELATNCLVFGNSPVRHSADGLFFAVKVEDAVQTFEGLPILGFTKLKPCDRPDLYPTVCRCLGSSVLTGSCGDAFARDKPEHFKMGFKPPPQHEVASWSSQADLPPHKRRPPVPVLPGDVLGCMYTSSGHIQLWRNGAMVLDFDTGRPVDAAVDYYAVVDVCLSVYAVSLLPDAGPEEANSRQLAVPRSSCGSPTMRCPTPTPGDAALEKPPTTTSNNIDAIISDVVNQALVHKAIQGAVKRCSFCVTIADPRSKDVPLIGVSEAFEQMTGYKRSEILGVNCRFLNQGCPISPADLMGLRAASESGSAFTALLPNRKKSGEMFINLLDLRGLVIGMDIETNEDLWYLIGIQADVTGLRTQMVPDDHVRELQEIASVIRNTLKKELSVLALGAEGTGDLDRQATCSSSTSDALLPRHSSANFRLLDEPCWRSGTLTPKGVSTTLESLPPPGSEKQATEANADRTALDSGIEHKQSLLASGQPLRDQDTVRLIAPVGILHAGLFLLSLLSFVTGLVLGRGSRRERC